MVNDEAPETYPMNQIFSNQDDFDDGSRYRPTGGNVSNHDENGKTQKHILFLSQNSLKITNLNENFSHYI